MPRIQSTIASLFIIASLSSLSRAQAIPTPLIPVNDSHLRILGRTDDRDPAHPRLAYPGTGIEFRLMGTSAELHVVSDSAASALTIVVDHGAPGLRLLAAGDNSVSIAMPVDNGPHTVQVYKRTETWQGILTLNGLSLAPGDEPPVRRRRERRPSALRRDSEEGRVDPVPAARQHRAAAVVLEPARRPETASPR